MFTATDWIRDKNGLMVLTPFPIKWAGKAAKQVYHKLRQKDTGNEATSRTFLQRKGSVLVQPLSLTSFDSSPSRGASGEEEKFSAMPKPPLQGATATTAASGGNREELLGPRPAGCERQRSRRWEPQPGQWHCEAMTERAPTISTTYYENMNKNSKKPYRSKFRSAIIFYACYKNLK